MGFRFSKSFRLFPGVRLNLGLKSWSISIGPRGAHRTYSSTGRRTTSVRLARGLRWTRSSRH